MIHHPDKVDKLSLVSPELLNFQEFQEDYIKLMTDYAMAVFLENKEGMISSLKTLNVTGKQERELDSNINSYVDSCLGAFVESKNNIRRPGIMEFFPLKKTDAVSAPALILYGEQDFDFVEKNSQKLEEVLSHAQLEKIPGSGHLVNLEQPDQFNKSLRDFLQKNQL
ncbi:MAG: alpha/beta hydrolase [Bacteroidia bacterium]